MNFPTLIVLIIVRLAAAMAVYSMHKAKNRENHAARGNCGGCSSAGMCHSKKNNE